MPVEDTKHNGLDDVENTWVTLTNLGVHNDGQPRWALSDSTAYFARTPPVAPFLSCIYGAACHNGLRRLFLQ